MLHWINSSSAGAQWSLQIPRAVAPPSQAEYAIAAHPTPGHSHPVAAMLRIQSPLALGCRRSTKPAGFSSFITVAGLAIFSRQGTAHFASMELRLTSSIRLSAQQAACLKQVGCKAASPGRLVAPTCVLPPEPSPGAKNGRSLQPQQYIPGKTPSQHISRHLHQLPLSAFNTGQTARCWL